MYVDNVLTEAFFCSRVFGPFRLSCLSMCMYCVRLTLSPLCPGRPGGPGKPKNPGSPLEPLKSNHILEFSKQNIQFEGIDCGIID